MLSNVKPCPRLDDDVMPHCDVDAVSKLGLCQSVEALRRLLYEFFLKSVFDPTLKKSLYMTKPWTGGVICSSRPCTCDTNSLTSEVGSYSAIWLDVLPSRSKA